MKKSILKLTLTCVVLFVLSILTYKWDHYRGVELVAGSEFLNALDIDNISSFSIRAKNGESLVFTRTGDSFNLQNYSNYPASGSEINELLYKLSTISVREKVSGNDFKKYGVDESDANYHFSFLNEKSEIVLNFYVGKSYNNKGNYIRKAQSTQIYLSESPLEVKLDKKSFVEKNILDFDKEKLERLELSGDVVIVKKDEAWVIDGLSKAKYQDEYIEEAIDDLQKVEFDNFYPEDDANVANLSFTQGANITLSNKMIYKLALARDKNRYFLKAQAETPEEIVLNPNASSEKLEEVNDLIKVQSGAENFNLRFKNWVFEISEYEYNKFIKKKNEFGSES